MQNSRRAFIRGKEYGAGAYESHPRRTPFVYFT